jgi:hypothetical protein
MNTREAPMSTRVKAVPKGSVGTTASKRPTRQRTHDRVTLSLPIEVGTRLRAEAKAAGAPSLSAYVLESLERAENRRTYRSLLEDTFKAEPMTDEERAWADEILDR